MTIKLTDADHDHLTALIYTIIDAVTARRITRMEAMSALAHVITAAAIGNEGEVRGWLRPEIVQRYLKGCDGALCPCCRRKPCILVEHFGSTL